MQIEFWKPLNSTMWWKVSESVSGVKEKTNNEKTVKFHTKAFVIFKLNVVENKKVKILIYENHYGCHVMDGFEGPKKIKIELWNI